jgi:hypothetical protein
MTKGKHKNRGGSFVPWKTVVVSTIRQPKAQNYDIDIAADLRLPADSILDEHMTLRILREKVRETFEANIPPACSEGPAESMRNKAVEQNRDVLPPGAGEVLITLFAPKNRIDALLGDLAESFAEDVEVKGEQRAKLLYWAGVVRSIGPLFWTKIKRAGWLAAVFEIGRRWIG